MRLGCIGLIIGLGLTAGGGQQLYESWNSGKRVDITYAELVKQKPGVGWYRVTDAEWRLFDAGLITKGRSGDATSDIYAPVLPKGQKLESQKIHVLLHRQDAGDAAKLEKLMMQSTDTGAMAVLVTEPSIEAPRKVEGMIEFGINTDDKSNDAVKKSFGDQLDENYMIITDGAKPAGYLWPALMLLGGLAILAFMLAGLVGKNDAAPGDPDPA